MDATNILEKRKAGYVFQNLKEGRAFHVGFNDTGLTGLKAVGTHQLATLDQGDAVVGGTLLITEAIVSAGNAATLQINVNGEDLTGALAEADLVAGAVIQLDLMSLVVDTYASAADLTVDLVIGGEAVLTGKFLLQVDVLRVEEITTRG